MKGLGDTVYEYLCLQIKFTKKGSSILNLICLLINPCCEHFRSDTKLKKAAVLQYGLVEIGKPRKRSNTTYPG